MLVIEAFPMAVLAHPALPPGTIRGEMGTTNSQTAAELSKPKGAFTSKNLCSLIILISHISRDNPALSELALPRWASVPSRECQWTEPDQHKSVAVGNSYAEKSKHGKGTAKTRHKTLSLRWMCSLNSLSWARGLQTVLEQRSSAHTAILSTFPLHPLCRCLTDPKHPGATDENFYVSVEIFHVYL